MTETFEYAIPADQRSAPRSSVCVALGFIVGFLVLLFTVAARPILR